MSVTEFDTTASRALQRYYPWVVIGIAFLTVAVAFGARNAFAVFLVAVIEEFHWSRALASGALMLIAQITDLHIGFDRNNPHELNVRRLNMVIDELNERTPRPDLLLVTGDLVENGHDARAYRHMESLVKRWQGPLLWAVGNHDDSATGLSASTVFNNPDSPQSDRELPLVEFDAVVRIDTPGEADYYRNGGIMQYVLRGMLRS